MHYFAVKMVTPGIEAFAVGDGTRPTFQTEQEAAAFIEEQKEFFGTGDQVEFVIQEVTTDE